MLQMGKREARRGCLNPLCHPGARSRDVILLLPRNLSLFSLTEPLHWPRLALTNSYQFMSPVIQKFLKGFWGSVIFILWLGAFNIASLGCPENIVGFVFPSLWTFFSGFLGHYTWSCENQEITHWDTNNRWIESYKRWVGGNWLAFQFLCVQHTTVWRVHTHNLGLQLVFCHRLYNKPSVSLSPCFALLSSFF